MEHRDDLAEVLLSGLPADERNHVVDVIRQSDAEKLRRKRASSDNPLDAADDDLDARADDDREPERI